MALFEAPKYGPMLNTQNGALKFAKKARREGIASVQTGINQGSAPLTEATTLFDPLIADKTKGYDMYQNSLGLNGEGGWDAAQAAYHPLFQAELDAANTNLSRQMANAGGWNSGEHAAGLHQLGQRMYRSGFEGWQDRLAGFDPSGAYGQKGSALTNLGKFLGDMYTNKANAGLQGAQVANSAFQSLASGQGANAQAKAAANNALPGLLTQGLINGVGGYFSGGFGA